MKPQLKSLLLPLLAAAYPILFLYAHNALVLHLGSLALPLGLTLLVAGLAYGLFYLFFRRPTPASLAAFVFVIFYYLYGFLYRDLLRLDRFPVNHFTLLPLVLVLAGYAGYGVSRIRKDIAAVLQNALLLVSTLLVVANLVIALPVEIKKAAPGQALVPVTAAEADTSQKKPDIYYIIFDEYVGFDAMRDYWHDPHAAQFDAFLKAHHFFVANGSRSPTINTGTEMASRLNLENVPADANSTQVMDAIQNNKVMRILKSYGYTNVVINMAFPDMKGDVTANFDPNSVGGMAADQFKRTFLADTMFSAFSGYIENSNQAAITQRDIIMYSLQRTENLSDVPSPKFVYTHLLLPHPPFIFDANGNLLPPQDANDWNYYLGQYIYATRLAEQLITNLLAQADPDNPPIIIIQSDEGARNLQDRGADNIVTNGYLENYPGQYNQYILNALYLPGYDYSTLQDNMPPVDTFQIVLNHYLNANVSITNWPGK